jgi:hypothetical protein
MKKLRDNGLSIVLGACFLILWIFQSQAGHLVHNQSLARDHLHTLTWLEYLGCSHFWQATGENWESEFLQMGVYVLLSSFLFQRGSAESKDPDKEDDARDAVENHSADPAAPASIKKGKGIRWIYQYSLSLSFLLLFALSFAIHALGGYAQQREEAAIHREIPPSFGEFLTGAEFWFQSLQNWQSEFLAVFSIVVLTIWLRHQGSPQSKKVWDSHQTTGTS